LSNGLELRKAIKHIYEDVLLGNPENKVLGNPENKSLINLPENGPEECPEQ
jgi:hypothetical protein